MFFIKAVFIICHSTLKPEKVWAKRNEHLHSLYIVIYYQEFFLLQHVLSLQRAKKVMSDSPRLVDFAIGLVMFVLNLPNKQVLFWGGNSNYRRIVINPANQKGFRG